MEVDDMKQLKEAIREGSRKSGDTWIQSISRGGEERWYAMLKALAGAVKHIKIKHPDLDEEELYTRGFEFLSDKIASESKGVVMYSRAAFSAGLRKCMTEFVDKENLPVIIYSLEQALLQGDDVSTKRKFELRIEQEEVREIAERLFFTLKTRNSDALQLRVGWNGQKATCQEIGDLWHVSGACASQYCLRAIRKLQNPIRAKYLASYSDADFFQEAELNRPSDFLPFVKTVPSEERIEHGTEKVEKAILRLEEKVGKAKARLIYQIFSGNPSGFIEYIKKRHGFIPTPPEIKKVLSLSMKERKAIKRRAPQKEKQDIKINDPYLDRLAEQLEPEEQEDYREIMLPRLVEAYMPVFVRGPTRMQRNLEHLASENNLFRKLKKHFDRIQSVKVPGLNTELRPYQKADVLFLESRPHVLYANEMGLGKSLTILAAFRKSGGERMLIVSPTSAAHGVWIDEIQKHFANPPTFVIPQRASENDLTRLFQEKEILILPYGMVHKFSKKLRELPFDWVVIDESHMITNQDTQRYRAIASIHAPKKILSSGTPFKNTRRELWAPLRWLSPERFDIDWEEYRERYLSEECLHVLAYDLRNVLVRRRKSEMLPHLPPVHSTDVHVRLKQTERKNYQSMEKDFLRWWKEEVKERKSVSHLLRGIVMSKLHALRMYAIQPKLRIIPSLTEEMLKNGEKVVVSTTYRQPARDIRDMFGEKEVCYIDGSTVGYNRAKEIQDFQNDPRKRVMIITEAGSQSVTLTAANNLIMVNDPWTWAAKQQTVDRLHRLGQERPVYVTNLLSSGTIDGEIRNLIESKREELSMVFDMNTEYLAYRGRELSDIHKLVGRLVS